MASSPTLGDASKRLAALFIAATVKLVAQALTAAASGFVIATILGAFAAWLVVVVRTGLGLFGG